jgi:hypothetical protein
MYYEIKFEFQIAARKRAASDQARSACSLAAKASTAFIARTDLTPFDRRDGSPLSANTSRAASHGSLIVTPRLECPATATKQSLGRISNGYKTAVFSSGLPAPAGYRQEPSPPEFLIANLELEFHLTHRKLSALRISNRKFLRVLHTPWSAVLFHSRLYTLTRKRAPRSNPCDERATSSPRQRPDARSQGVTNQFSTTCAALPAQAFPDSKQERACGVSPTTCAD